METHKPLLKDVDGEDVDEHLYKSMIGSLMYLTSSIVYISWFYDFVLFHKPTGNGKSTIGGCQFIGHKLISWQCKKQTVVANSTTKAEYIAASNCYGQVLWIQNQMLDYRDSNEKKLIQMIKIHTDENVANLLTKAFDVSRFQYLIAKNADFAEIVDFLNANPISSKSTAWNEFDDTATKERGDRMEMAATTVSSLEVEHDSGNINRTQSMATLNEPSP
ncbi:hypothetical protein Tco_0080667 [Tanacetum coccineum]